MSRWSLEVCKPMQDKIWKVGGPLRYASRCMQDKPMAIRPSSVDLRYEITTALGECTEHPQPHLENARDALTEELSKKNS